MKMSKRITILENKKGKFAKTFFIGKDGLIRCKDYDNAYEVAVHHFDFDDIEDFYDYLTFLQHHPSLCIIHGDLIKEGMFYNKKEKTYLRRMNSDTHSIVYFKDIETHWVCIDYDKIANPMVADVEPNLREISEYLVSKLPKEFHNASYISTYSSSAGFNKLNGGNDVLEDTLEYGWDTVSLHIFFCIEPRTSEWLWEWGKRFNSMQSQRVFDPRMLLAIQPNYTANPVFRMGIEDPVENRMVFVKKAMDEVNIIEIPEIRIPVEASVDNAYTSGSSSLDQMIDRIGTTGYYTEIYAVFCWYVRSCHERGQNPSKGWIIDYVMTRKGAEIQQNRPAYVRIMSSRYDQAYVAAGSLYPKRSTDEVIERRNSYRKTMADKEHEVIMANIKRIKERAGN